MCVSIHLKNNLARYLALVDVPSSHVFDVSFLSKGALLSPLHTGISDVILRPQRAEVSPMSAYSDLLPSLVCNSILDIYCRCSKCGSIGISLGMVSLSREFHVVNILC